MIIITSLRHLKTLELDKILEICSQSAVSAEAAERIMDIQPADEYSYAVHMLSQTDAASSLSIRHGNPPVSAINPCKDSVGRAERSAQLSTKELLEIAQILRCARTLGVWYKSAAESKTPLEPLFESLAPNSYLEKEIARCIIAEDEIADNASSELMDMRRKIKNANQKARETLEKIVRSNTYQKFLQDQIITMRNGRFVVPVKAEHKQEIKGLVHDTSSSGSTLFIEPMTVVELNNQIRELEVAQQDEINRILYTLSAEVANDAENILSNYDAIVEIDIVFAKAKLGDKLKAVTPILVESGETVINHARHPLINKDIVVPIDIRVGGDFDTLVVTGPNTGGKTVALKTLGLLTVMAQCGFMIPASSQSKIAFYESILADIGDEQSIEQSLSTFSGHMTNIVRILKQADEKSLVLIDELGAGTDPTEGAALAVAIIKKLRKQGAKIAATTHYAEMKIFALQTEGVENASCEFDVVTLRPTYRLIIGTPGRSNAFAISQRLGLPSDIIRSAEELVSTENKRFEDVVSSLEEARFSLEQEKKQAQQLRIQAASVKQEVTLQSEDLKKQEEKILTDARSRAQTILERVKYQAEQIIGELEELKKQKDKADFANRFSAAQGNFKKMLNDMEDIANPVLEHEEYKLPRPLKDGDNVFLVDFNTNGIVVSLPDNKGYLRVKSGILETKVLESRVRLADKSKPKVTYNGGTVNSKKSSDNKDATGKLDLRGLDSSEAEMELMRFIDRSILQHLKTLTIVHGKGTGVLRDMVKIRLKNNKHVDNYRLGGYGEGGDGVTIVELK